MYLKNISLFFMIGFLLWANSAVGQKPQQTPTTGLTRIPLNLAPPGARALGMGGAFIGIADDATASEANPAGLTILSRPEVSVHYRSSAYDISLTDTNAQLAIDIVADNRDFLLSDPPVIGVGPFVRRPSTLVRWDRDVSDVSFASFVYPFKKVVFSVYFLQTNSFEGNSLFELVDEGFIDFFTTTTAVDSSLESLGASVAFKLTNFVSLGLSLRSSRLQLTSSQVFRFDYFTDFENPFALDSNGQIIVNPNPDLDHTDFFRFSDLLDDTDDQLTFNAGLLFNPNGKFSAGLVYKEGGEFEIDGAVETFVCFDPAGPGRDCRSGAAPLFDGRVATTTPIKVPDFWGLGLAARPTDRLTLAVDVNRITYSDLALPPARRIAGIHEDIDDATEIHLGLEYTVFASETTPLSLRCGLWNEPDHDGFATVESEQTHLTVGLGIVHKSLQIDLAGHFSDTVDEGILSLVYRF